VHHLTQLAPKHQTRVEPQTVVDQSTEEALPLQHGESVHSLAFGQKVGTLDVLRTSQEVVELCTGPEVGSLPPLLDRNHDWKPLREMRSGVQKVAPFAECLDHQLVPVGLRLAQSHVKSRACLTGCSPGSKRPFPSIVHRRAQALCSCCLSHC
jgi:hypothetical protein